MGTLTYHLKFVPRISEQGQPAGSMPELSHSGACLQGGGGGGGVRLKYDCKCLKRNLNGFYSVFMQI